MTWDSLASSTLMRSWPRCALCNDDVLQAKLFPTKYHPVCIEGRHSVLETDLWRKGLLTRPGHQGELVAVSMVKLKRSSSSKKLAASVLLEMEFLILKTFSFQHKQANIFILPLPSFDSYLLMTIFKSSPSVCYKRPIDNWVYSADIKQIRLSKSQFTATQAQKQM